MASRFGAGAVAAVLLAVSLSLPVALGGSVTDPEIRDDCESEDDPTIPGQADVEAAWMLPASDELVIQVCGDLQQEQAGAARLGWQFRFNDTEGTLWEVKAWATLGNWWQCVTRDGDRLGGDERQGGQTPYPRTDPDTGRVVLHFPPAGTDIDMPIRRDLHVVGFLHNATVDFGLSVDSSYHASLLNYSGRLERWAQGPPDPGEPDPSDPLNLSWVPSPPGPPSPGSASFGVANEPSCGMSFDPMDRAPDTGFGRDLNVSEPDPSEIDLPLGVDVHTTRPQVTVRPGTSAEIPVVADQVLQVHREIDLTVDATETWSPSFEVSWIQPKSAEVRTVDFGPEVELVVRPLEEFNRTTLTLSVPESTPPGTYPITFSGTARNETGFFADEVSLTSEVTVPPFGLDASGQETRFLVQPGGAVVNGIEIANTGEMRDTYDLSLTGEPAEWASLERDVVEVDAGGSVTVPLTVEIAPNASNGVYSHTVEAVSGTLSGVRDRITTTVQVLDGAFADPLGAVLTGEPTPTVVGLFALAIGSMTVIGAAAGKP